MNPTVTAAEATITALAYELGTLHPLESLSSAGVPDDEIAVYRQKDLSTYSRINGDLIPVIQRCVTQTLRSGDRSSEFPGAVMFVTETFTELSAADGAGVQTPVIRAYRDLFTDALADVGVVNVPIFCSTFGGSSNLLQALYLLKPMVEHSPIGSVLLVCVDRLPPSVSRLMTEAVAVTGDGVASALVTGAPGAAPGFAIEHVAIRPYLHANRAASWSQLLLDMYRATKAAAADCYDAVACQPSQYAQLILSNYNPLSCRTFTQLLGFDSTRAFSDNVSRTGHMPSCDALVNMKDLMDRRRVTAGGRVLLYSNGPISCGAVSLVAR